MRWTVRAQVINAVLTLRTMHQDARDVLVSEIVCDTMYAIFFGGFRFTYNHQKSGQTICAQTSPIVDIVHEIKHRLGYLPELAKTEGSQRQVIGSQEENQAGVLVHRPQSKHSIHDLCTYHRRKNVRAAR